MRIALEGRQSGRDAYSAVVRLKTGAGVQTKVKAGGAGYLAQPDPRLLFGIGEGPDVEAVEIRWPDGSSELWREPKPGRYTTIVKGSIAEGESAQ